MSENSKARITLDRVVDAYERILKMSYEEGREYEREACIKILQSFAATGKTYLTDDIIKEIAKRGEVK
jgi:hypothetical protein